MTDKPANENKEFRDLGFGARVADHSSRRLLNQDGSFNTIRRGLGLTGYLNLYHRLLTMSWPAFVVFLAVAYLLANGLFAIGYLMCGPDGLAGSAGPSSREQFLQAFFFSVHTLATVGYGNVVPVNFPANILVTLETMLGLFGLALATGLVFARFSRPTAKIVFSHHAVVAPYRGISAFEFRIANQRKNEIVDLEARVMMSRMENEDGRVVRRFYPLELERGKVSFFTLTWTIVHPINEESPFFGMTEEDCRSADVEVLVLLTGIDETFSQMVHARSSYKPQEVIWHAKFEDIYQYLPDQGPISIDVSRIHNVVRSEPASAGVEP